jgi:hypothetical protein
MNPPPGDIHKDKTTPDESQCKYQGISTLNEGSKRAFPDILEIEKNHKAKTNSDQPTSRHER